MRQHLRDPFSLSIVKDRAFPERIEKTEGIERFRYDPLEELVMQNARSYVTALPVATRQ